MLMLMLMLMLILSYCYDKQTINQWMNNWQLDKSKSCGACDEEGWSYGPSLEKLEDAMSKGSAKGLVDQSLSSYPAAGGKAGKSNSKGKGCLRPAHTAEQTFEA